jgi:hypothetical protein
VVVSGIVDRSAHAVSKIGAGPPQRSSERTSPAWARW